MTLDCIGNTNVVNLRAQSIHQQLAVTSHALRRSMLKALAALFHRRPFVIHVRPPRFTGDAVRRTHTHNVSSQPTSMCYKSMQARVHTTHDRILPIVQYGRPADALHLIHQLLLFT